MQSEMADCCCSLQGPKIQTHWLYIEMDDTRAPRKRYHNISITPLWLDAASQSPPGYYMGQISDITQL